MSKIVGSVAWRGVYFTTPSVENGLLVHRTTSVSRILSIIIYTVWFDGGMQCGGISTSRSRERRQIYRS